MKAPSTLESVTAEFIHWRSSRASTNEAIPKQLRTQAIELLSHYKKSQIIAALKINHSSLKRWQQKGGEESSGFVALAFETQAPLISPASPERSTFSGLNITLRNTSGIEMCINGDMTPALLHDITRSFLTLQGGES